MSFLTLAPSSQSTKTALPLKHHPSLLIWLNTPALPSRSHRRSSKSTGGLHLGLPPLFFLTWARSQSLWTPHSPQSAVIWIPWRQSGVYINTASAKGQQAPIMPLVAGRGKVLSSPMGNQWPPTVIHPRKWELITVPFPVTMQKMEPPTHGEWISCLAIHE